MSGLTIKQKARYAGFFAFLLAPFAHAIEPHASSISVFAERNDHTFSEYGESDIVLVREQAKIDHFGALLHWQFDSGLFVAVSTQRGKGTALYQGVDQLQRYIEHHTEYLISEQQLYLGRQFGNTEARIGIGSHYRERNIIDGGLYEELDWRFASFGLAKRIAMGAHWQLKLFGEVGLALDSQLKAEFSGAFDPVTVTPGRITTSVAGVELLFKVTRKFTIALAPSYNFVLVKPGDDYPLNREGIAIGVASQPKTEYETLAWTLKLNKTF